MVQFDIYISDWAAIFREYACNSPKLLTSFPSQIINPFHREESQGEIVNKLDAEVYEREMDEEEDEGMEATMEETAEEKVKEMEELVQEEIGNINKEDKLYI